MDFVIAELRVHMSRQTQGDSIRDVLRWVHESKRLPDKFDRSLLQSLLIVEYSNALRWYDVHPILREYVRTFGQ